jgi:spectinomycin phosphotransferase
MLEKPNISDELIFANLQAEYEVYGRQLDFHPSGDSNSAVYHVITERGTKCFLKLKQQFDEISVEVPLFLKSRGIAAVLSPYQTKSKRYRVDCGEYKMILYPFIEGKNGFEVELSPYHKHSLGATLKSIHSTPVPPRLESLLPREGFAPRYRERVRSFQARAEQISCRDALAARLASFIKTRSREISHLIKRTEELAAKLRSEPPELVLCHSDVHGRNILIGEAGELYIVDWDEPILAPKERDLMFIGGGIDRIWKSEQDEHIFYEGYGETNINLSALAYYRYERIIEDLAAYGEQLLASDGSTTDRERLYQYFTGNFESSTRMEIAKKTDELLAPTSRLD